MPIYTYRREDGTTFEIRQKFTDDALQIDPQTGQKVVRVVHAANIVFKGSGFYVTDNKSAHNAAGTNNENGKATSNGNGAANGSSSEGASSSTNGSAKAEASTSKSNGSSSASAPAGSE
ncbi:FmdB family transcriptional regulator [Phototrophicus methaneseepsis]|uniref:FmdB family transcriptional regulator n=1 Tax=Phototrophicus methaneseepsis TaxID=2710758 RepID=A0A7S8IEV9_9CHLR|nr:FmdB family transcriptional regulator [Phototrophicus methaneseepsis]QPC82859.1 FmdB family transcriptional regulator [Phototrophicus methaneseepsis]